MELWEVFEKLVNEKGTKVSDIAKATEIPYTNDYGIKRLKLYLDEVLLADKDCLKERKVTT